MVFQVFQVKLFMWCWLETKACGAVCYCFYCVSIHVDPIYGLMLGSLDFSMPMWFTCSCFSALSCSDAGTLGLPPFMVIYQWLPSYPWMTSIASIPSVPLYLLMTSHRVHTLREYLATHHLVLPVLCLLLSWSLVPLCMTLFHWWLYTCLAFLHLCWSCGCV